VPRKVTSAKRAQNRILAILGKAPTEDVAAAGFTRASQTLVGWWDDNDDRQNPRPVIGITRRNLACRS